MTQALLTTLTQEQQAALDSILAWLDDPYGREEYLLSGYAGTGKTYTVRKLIEVFKGRIVFTAPTNKATKVLRSTLRSAQYNPECRTIYSLLGLKLEANGEVKELKVPEDPIDLSKFRLIVVDEASMLNKVVLGHLREMLSDFKGLRVLYMGDYAQLPPVGEERSGVWELPDRAELTKVMRHSNRVLELATAVRKIVDSPAVNISSLLLPYRTGGNGVEIVSAHAFTGRILAAAELGELTSGSTKIIAWRNATVDSYNTIARRAIFRDEAARSLWLPGDRLIFTEPAKDFNDEIVATVDDEGLVEKVFEEYHPIHGDIKCFRLTVQIDQGPLVVVYAVHPEGRAAYARQSEQLAQEARAISRKWRDYWAFKESFHSVRHAYAITAHRSQGSTYKTALVDMRDILLNRNRREAFRCFYVGLTRPSESLVLT